MERMTDQRGSNRAATLKLDYISLNKVCVIAAMRSLMHVELVADASKNSWQLFLS